MLAVSHNFDTAPGPVWSHTGPPFRWTPWWPRWSCSNDLVPKSEAHDAVETIAVKWPAICSRKRKKWLNSRTPIWEEKQDSVQRRRAKIEYRLNLSATPSHDGTAWPSPAFSFFPSRVFSLKSQILLNIFQPKNALSCPVSRACWWTRSEDRQETGSFWERLAAQMVQESFLVGHYLVKRFKTWVVEEFVTWSAYYFTKLVNNT